MICTRGFVPVRNAAGAIVGNSGCDYNADGTNLDRPNAPVLRGLAQRLQRRLHRPESSRPRTSRCPGSGQPGTLGRNTFFGPRYFNVDLALVKGFKISRADLQLRVEAFNAFNTVNLYNPVNNLADPLFGSRRQPRSGPDLPGLGPRRVLDALHRFRFSPRGDRASLRGVRLCGGRARGADVTH